MKAIINGKIVTPVKLIQEGILLIENGRILALGKKGDIDVPAGCEVVNAAGMYVGPGFVDIHCHGGDLYSSHEAPGEAARFHLKHGTTSIVLALSYDLTPEETFLGIEAIKKVMKEGDPKNLKGLFFEGPFNNPNFGASSESGRPINRDEYEALYEKAGEAILQWMYAPELEGGDDFARFVVSKGIPLAIGHTAASPDIVEKAVNLGARICSHLFDAMGCHLGNDSVSITQIIQDTAVDAAMTMEELFLEIICDSRAVHVKPANLRLAYKCGGADRVVLITDYSIIQYNPTKYHEEDIRSAEDLNFNERGQLWGSKLSMDNALKNMHRYTGAPVIDLFKMASTNPAKAVKLFDKIGSLEPGKAADIVLLDGELNLKKVLIEGEEVLTEGL